MKIPHPQHIAFADSRIIGIRFVGIAFLLSLKCTLILHAQSSASPLPVQLPDKLSNGLSSNQKAFANKSIQNRVKPAKIKNLIRSFSDKNRQETAVERDSAQSRADPVVERSTVLKKRKSRKQRLDNPEVDIVDSSKIKIGELIRGTSINTKLASWPLASATASESVENLRNKAQLPLKSLSGISKLSSDQLSSDQLSTGSGDTFKNLADSLFNARFHKRCNTKATPGALCDTRFNSSLVTGSQLNPDSLVDQYAASYGEKLANEIEARLNAQLQKRQPQLEKSLGNTVSDSPLFNANSLPDVSLPDPSLADTYFKKVADQLISTQVPDQLPGQIINGTNVAPNKIDLNNINPNSIDLNGYLQKLKQEHLPDPAALQAGTKQIQSLKQKYQSLADSRKTNEATSKNSLKKYPLHQRLEVGIGATILSLQPFGADFSPIMGYRISRVWTTGAGLILSAGASQSSVPAAPSVNSGSNAPVTGSKAAYRNRESFIFWEGYQLYTLYSLTSYLRLHAVYQYRRSQLETEADSHYSHQLLGGISNEIKLIRSVRLRSTVLYRLNRKDAYLNGFRSPFQVSVGIVRYLDQ